MKRILIALSASAILMAGMTTTAEAGANPHGLPIPGGVGGPDGVAFRATPAIRIPPPNPYQVGPGSPLIKPAHPALSSVALAPDAPLPVLNNTNCKGYAIFTFDDGPSADTTQKLLDEMNAENIHGYFFVIGDMVTAPGGAQLIQNEAASGDLVENHTWDHQSFTGISTGTPALTPAQLASEISQDQAAITAAGLPAPAMYRPPYGDVNATNDAQIRNQFGLQIVAPFSVNGPVYGPGSGNITDSRDWTGAGTAQIVQNVTTGYTSASGRFYPGMSSSLISQPDILAFHDTTGTQLYDALPQIVTWMNANNFCATRTMRTDATGGLVPTPPQQEPPPAQNLTVNPSVETDWAAGNYGGFPVTWPAGWIPAGWGTRTATYSTTAAAHTGSQAVTASISNWASGTADWVIVMRGNGTSSSNTYTPSTDAQPGHTYNFWTWYEGTATGSIGIVTYYRDANNVWQYWTSSYAVPNSPNAWNLAWFTTPPLPAGATAVSFGLSVSGNGSVTSDDYASDINP